MYSRIAANLVSSTIIEDVLSSQHQGACVIFFYFDFKDVEKRKVDSLLGSLLVQLGNQDAYARKVLTALYEDHQGGQRQVNSSKRLSALKDILGKVRRSYIVLDALDECYERGDLMDCISQIIQWQLKM